MPTARIRLAHSVPAGLAPELAKRLYFVSSAIEGFDLVTADDASGSVWAVDVELDSPHADDVRDLERKVDRMVAQEILGQREMPPKRVWSSAAPPAVCVDAEGLLADGDALFRAGDGQVGFGEPLLSLFEYFDRRLRAIALRLENAREYRYPTLLPASVLERFDYFASFPHFVMFVTRLHNDLDVYDAFVTSYREEGRLPEGLLGHCRDHSLCLPPTMCYHAFEQHAGRQLVGDRVVTARGKSFRFESRYHAGMKRLWDFTIREIVFLGSPDFVHRSRRSVLDAACALMDELGLVGVCEVANDHFFLDRETATRIFSQRLMELKYELLLDVGPDEAIAVASFNAHGRYFGEAFGIDGDDGTITSGCVGFGLERLVFAFLCQRGVDPAGWPESVRRAVEAGGRP
ncbi:MAG: hypothetical protein AAGC60_23150 [Acidobacteriota bacterium]